MQVRQSLPNLWLFSDARNDAVLEEALARLPRGSGFVYRHTHLEPDKRLKRFKECAGILRELDLLKIIIDDPETALDWGADGIYGPAERLGAPQTGLLRLATAHNGPEIAAAEAAEADAIFLSPVFPTRSHPGEPTLGVMGFQALAQQTSIPIIALGGMTQRRARELDWPRWAAIDGLS